MLIANNVLMACTSMKIKVNAILQLMYSVLMALTDLIDSKEISTELEHNKSYHQFFQLFSVDVYSKTIKSPIDWTL